MITGREGQLFGGKVVITIHKPIVSTNADTMTSEAQEAVESALELKFHAPKEGATTAAADAKE